MPRRGEYWQILRCTSCGFGWTSPQPSAEELAAYYPSTYHGDTRRTLDEYLSGRLTRTRSWRGEQEKVELIQRYIKGGHILDVGCGDGKFLWAMEPAMWARSGVDFAAATLDEVRARMPSLRLIAGDISAADLAEGSFDVITFWHALEHIPSPGDCLGRAFALLRPGGWLFVSLPNLDSLQARLFSQYWYCFDDVPRHLYHFSRQSLEIFLGKAGLEVVARGFFSRRVSFHSLKHSLMRWSREICHSSAPYYMVKPLLFAFPLLERLTGKYGILTIIARKPGH